MTSLHPEELLDRERRGTLDASGREQLDAHTAECSACALSRRVVDDFSQDLRAEAGDDDLLARAIDKALDAPARRSERRSWRTLLIAVAAALVAAAAVAATIRLRTPDAIQPPIETPVAPPPEVKAPEKAEPARVVEATTEVDPPEKEAPKAEKVPTAAELFASATRARRDKKDDEAIRLYRELQRRYPDSREAKASRVVLGQLLLDRTDPNQALGEFDKYLDGGAKGTVTEEALVGRAVALQKLGKTTEERAAWKELLAKFPSSVHAARARERLQATSP